MCETIPAIFVFTQQEKASKYCNRGKKDPKVARKAYAFVCSDVVLTRSRVSPRAGRAH